MMETKDLKSDEIVLLSFSESCSIKGGGEEGWDYIVAEYVGVGVGYGVKKLLKALRFMSANIYALRDNPKLLYQ